MFHDMKPPTRPTLISQGVSVSLTLTQRALECGDYFVRGLFRAHFIRKLQKISLEEGLVIPTICTPQEITNE